MRNIIKTDGGETPQYCVNFTNAKARTLGKKELRRVFRDCRFKDALTLAETPPDGDDFIFYYNKARDGLIGNYIIYEVVSTDARVRADDAVIGREFFTQIDVFCVKSFESKLLTDALERLEEKLTAAGFMVDAQGEDYEPDTRLYHHILFVSKLYF